MESLSVVGLAAGGGNSNPFIMFVPILILVAMMVILFRAQKKEAKRRQEMLDAVKTGDKIITAGGIYGIVTNAKEKSLIVKIADNVKVEITRSGVSSIVEKEDK